MRSLFLATAYLLILYPSILEAQDKVQFLLNEKPRYADTEFITFEELHSIDLNMYDQYFISKISAFDVDSDTNLYVAAQFENTITVFDKSGNFVRKMGREGQGPNDLDSPANMNIHNGLIYIYESRRGMKIWDLNGEYVDYVPKNTTLGNFVRLDDFYIMAGMQINSRMLVEMTYELAIYNNDFKLKKRVAMLTNKNAENPQFHPIHAVAINSEQHVYFPEKADEYIINKFDLDGTLLQSFGREYKRIPYSEKVKIFERNRQSTIPAALRYSLPKYPPVIRSILVSDNDLVWVIAGEWNLDTNQIHAYSSTIDIFDKNGNFLYTFSLPYFGRYSIIKNGQLYSTPTEDDRFIRVFKINYKY